LKDPPTKAETSNKRKVSLQKSSARKNTCVSKPQMEDTLTKDDISLVCRVMEDASEDILQRYRVKQDEFYGRIERELSEVQEVICSVCAVPTTPSSS
jgi:hypothetical protein